MTARVVITDYTFPDLSHEREAARSAGAAFAAHQCREEAEVADAVDGATVVAVQFAPFGESAARAVAAGASIIRYGVGYENIDLLAAAEAGLRVGYVPDYCAGEVADHTAAAILALLRKLMPLDKTVRSGEWTPVESAKPLKSFSRTTIGFYGLGQIGRGVLARLAAHGFRFIARDPALSEADAAALGVRPVDEAELLATADVLSLHAPATPETTGFLNSEALRRMQPGAYVVNCARGQLVNEKDLAAALEEGVIAGAALDVFDQEPLPADSPLRRAPGVILTPHCAWYSEAAIDRLQRLVAQDITRALHGRGLRRPVPGYAADRG